MKTFVGGLLAVFLSLFVLTTFVPAPEAVRAEAARYFTEADIATGEQFSFERRLLFWGSTAAQLGLLLTLGLTAFGRRVADALGRACRGSWGLTLLGVGATCYLLDLVVQFPFAVARFYHSKAWGMTERPFGPWLSEYLLAQAVLAGLEGIVVVGLYLLLRYAPRRWWYLAAISGGAMGAVFALLLPVLVAPLFNTFTPLAQTEWASLEPSVRKLVAAADVPVQEILVMDASRQGSHTNAYFTGFGSTRRIVLYDTLLKNHDGPELESILAHELGHWQHDHIVKGLLLGTTAALVGLFVLDRILRRLLGRAPWRLTGLADPAGLPLITLLMYLGSWVAQPIECAVSRHFERQADQASLDLAGQPDVFIRAEIRLARVNKMNVAPAPWTVWLFATHPPPVSRIQHAAESDKVTADDKVTR